MHSGVVFPQTEFGNDVKKIKDYAQAAEALGYDYLLVYDHVLGENFKTRGRRMEVEVEVLRKLWTEPLVTYRSSQHVIENAALNPMPIQRPIPIWFGGSAEPALKRAACLADGWMRVSGEPDSARVLVEQLEGYLKEAGRHRKSFPNQGESHPDHRPRL